MAGESAQQVYEHQRDNRRGRNRRMWRWTLAAVVVAFALGWVLSIAFPSLLLSLVTRIGAGEETSFVIYRPPAVVSAFVATMAAVVAATKMLAPSSSEVAWRKGAEGERAVGAALDALADRAEVRTLHDRKIPGSRANIDHLAVTPAGVFTVDAKHYAGRLEVRGRDRQLRINGRNRSTLIEQAQRQVATVSAVLADAGMGQTPVTPILCFVGTQLPGGPFVLKRVDRVVVTAPSKLRRWLLPRRGAARLTPQEIEEVAGVLDGALVPAARPTDRRYTEPPPGTHDRAPHR